jgi:hypothetical protein
MSRQARRADVEERIAAHVDFDGPGFTWDDHCRMNAVLGLMLDALEPDPANRPTVSELFTYPLFRLPPRQPRAESVKLMPRKRKAE